MEGRGYNYIVFLGEAGVTLMGHVLRIELVVEAAVVQELLVSALFDHAAFVDGAYLVRVLDRAEPMSDDNACSALLSSVQSVLDHLFRLTVQGRSRFVQ